MSYQEEFNKQLAKQMQWYRQNQPNHIPVYAMKYKEASKYLIEDLKQPLSLFPKKFKLNNLYEKIKEESLQYSKSKFKADYQAKQAGDHLLIPEFYLYTITIKDEKQYKLKKIRGQFVSLDLQMQIGEAYEKYGRDNILTIVYTDEADLKKLFNLHNQPITQTKLMWIVGVIFFLIALSFFVQKQPKNIENGSQNLQKAANNTYNISLNQKSSDKIYEN